MEVGGGGKKQRQAGPQGAARRPVPDGPVEAVGQQGREGHGEAGGRTCEQRDPAVGEHGGNQRGQQRRGDRAGETPREQPERQQAEKDGGQASGVPAGRRSGHGGDRRIDERKRQIIEVRLEAFGVVPEVEFVDVVENRGAAAEGVEPEPEMVQQLQMVARHERMDSLQAGIDVGVGNRAGKEARQGPGGHGPQPEAGQQQQPGKAGAG